MFDEYHSPINSKFSSKLNKKTKSIAVPNIDETPVALAACNSSELITVKENTNNPKKLQLQVNSNTTLHNSKFSSLKTPTTPIFTDPTMLSSANPFLIKSFNNQVKLLGKGEFSQVYQVNFQNKAYAIKQLVNKTKNGSFINTNKQKVCLNTELNTDPISKHLGILNMEKVAFSEEVEVLNAIKRSQHHTQNIRDNYAKYIINYVDFFQFESNNYIVAEFYEKGTLDQFLLSHGITNKLDEFRIWKILLELTKGLSFLHSNNILHLDLKPANIFVSNDGCLKIGDFGLSTFMNDYDDNNSSNPKENMSTYSQKIDKEGDREYIAPEVLSESRYGTPADIFSLGLIIVEIAANIFLPDNGVCWQKLRNGDLSDAGNLSKFVINNNSTVNNNFINDGKTLDLLVHWMIEPDYSNRPNVQQLLSLFELSFIDFHKKRPATIYEPEFDPSSNSTSSPTQHCDRQSDFNDIIIEENMYDLDSNNRQSISEVYHLSKFHQ